MSWHRWLRCPSCRGRLSDDGGLRCEACARHYPAVGGIVVLLPDPEAEIANWCYRLDDFVRDNADVRAKILAQLSTEAKLEGTRRRLDTLHRSLETHRDRLLALLAEAGVTPRARATPDPAPVPGEATITAYYHQIHRDWGWEADENREARHAAAAIGQLAGNVGRMLVLGAGAARLARDVHVEQGAKMTIALDRNPLPFIVATRILQGESVRLYEFPIRAPTSDAVCIDRELSSAAPPAPDFHLLFADGLDPPVPDAAFDTVLTPWFVDQVPADMATLLPTIHRVLRDGGRWINFGPLIYHPTHTRLVHRYCYDEVIELVSRGGFELECHRYARMEYMASPAGCEARIESVLTFVARKSGPARGSLEDPEWLSDTTRPVPRPDGLDAYAPPHPLFGAVAALVDGRRSIDDIARILIDRHGLPHDAATPGVQAALREITRAFRR